MSEHMSSDEQIQSLYNQTKNLRSPTDLDNIILGKIHTLEEEPTPVLAEKLWIYLPIAASILLVVLLQFRGMDKSVNQTQIEIAQLPIEKKLPAKLKNRQKRQLPELFFLPTEDINNKVVRACTAGLVTPEERIATLNKQQKTAHKDKTSNIPVHPIYPNDTNNKNPEYDSVCRQIFKK